MSQFKFRLQTLLNYRCRRRDECREALAKVLMRAAELEAEQERMTQLRIDQLQHLRELNNAAELNIDAAAARRFYVGQITAALSQLGRQREMVAAEIDLCRQTLVEADRDVQVLERLSEKQQAEHEFTLARAGQLELEECWSAARSQEDSSC